MRNLLIYIGMASRGNVLSITLPPWHCRICGSVPVFWHLSKWGFRNWAEWKCSVARLRSGACDSDLANSLLESGSLLPRCAAAPFGPVATLLHCTGSADVL